MYAAGLWQHPWTYRLQAPESLQKYPWQAFTQPVAYTSPALHTSVPAHTFVPPHTVVIAHTSPALYTSVPAHTSPALYTSVPAHTSGEHIQVPPITQFVPLTDGEDTPPVPHIVGLFTRVAPQILFPQMSHQPSLEAFLTHRSPETIFTSKPLFAQSGVEIQVLAQIVGLHTFVPAHRPVPAVIIACPSFTQSSGLYSAPSLLRTSPLETFFKKLNPKTNPSAPTTVFFILFLNSRFTSPFCSFDFC